MSSKKTSNLQLHRWESTDAVSRAEFNENFAKLDTAVGAAQAELLGKNGIVAGKYAGNGAASQVIALGFTPKAVLVLSSNGYSSWSDGGYTRCYGGLALAGVLTSMMGATTLAIVEGGFVAYNGSVEGAAQILLNYERAVYHYLAVM